MWIRIFNAFVRLTAYPVQLPVFRTKITYEDKRVQSRRIKGAAIVVSNHTTVWDYAVWMFVFFGRTLRAQMAEVLFEKPVLGLFLKWMGGLRVDRNAHEYGFMAQSLSILQRGGVVEIYPESRLPLKGEQRPLPFKPGAAYLALISGAPVIPVFTNGAYFSKRRARVVIGKPLYAADFADEGLSEKENLERISAVFRDKIISLETLLNESTQKS